MQAREALKRLIAEVQAEDARMPSSAGAVPVMLKLLPNLLEEPRLRLMERSRGFRIETPFDTIDRFHDVDVGIVDDGEDMYIHCAYRHRGEDDSMWYTGATFDLPAAVISSFLDDILQTLDPAES